MKHFCDIDMDEMFNAAPVIPPHGPGELDGFGTCLDCDENWSAAPGVYYCPWCSDGDY